MSSSESRRPYSAVLFHSVQGAIGAEKLLITAGIVHKLISVPRNISSNCGFCLRILAEDKDPVSALLSKQELGIERIVDL